MPDNVSIAYRGANYAIGQGPGFYAIWPAAVPQAQPLEWWPLTPTGWAAAWMRFASIEEPFTITPVMAPPAPTPMAGPALQAAAPSPMAGPALQAAAPSSMAGAGVTAPAAESLAASAPVPAADSVTAAKSVTAADSATTAHAGTADASAASAPAPGAAFAGEGGPAPAQPFASGTPGRPLDAAYAIDPAYGQVVPRAARQARPGRTFDPASANLYARIAAGLLAVGVVLGVVGFFPSYNTGTSLASQSSALVPHIFYVVAWAAAAVLILFGGIRRQAGALLGLSMSAVTLGFFLSDVGTPISDGARFFGAGLVLSLLGWLACTAGAALAFAPSGLSFRTWPGFRFGRGALTGPSGHEIVPTITLILATIGAAIAFAPSWDRITLNAANAGVSQTVTEGNAFSNPAAVIVGDVAVMVLLVAVVVVAALWRPRRLGAAVAAGAIIPLVAEAVSAMIQTAGMTPGQLGYSSAEVATLGLSVSAGLTPMFWVFCAFTATMILLCAWLLLTPESGSDQPSPYVPHGLTIG